MSTFVGRKFNPGAAPAPEPKRAKTPEPKAEKTRAQLAEEAEELGLAVPPKATKAQIQKLIDEAPVI